MTLDRLSVDIELIYQVESSSENYQVRVMRCIDCDQGAARTRVSYGYGYSLI